MGHLLCLLRVVSIVKHINGDIECSIFICSVEVVVKLNLKHDFLVINN